MNKKPESLELVKKIKEYVLGKKCTLCREYFCAINSEYCPQYDRWMIDYLASLTDSQWEESIVEVKSSYEDFPEYELPFEEFKELVHQVVANLMPGLEKLK